MLGMRQQAFVSQFSPCFRHAHHKSCSAKTALKGTCLRRPRANQFTRYGRVVVAVQTRPVSGDSDGEVRESPPQQKSYSIGVTIVSGCDARLRRNVIEKIAAQSDVGRIVVITSGGIVSTEEPDGRRVEQVALGENEAIEGQEGLNGYVAPPVTTQGQSTTQSAVVDNLEGWISCSSPDEMAEVAAKLAASRDCDYIIAEGATGNSMEPQVLAELLHVRGGASLRVDSLVSVLDGDTLMQDLSTNTTSEALEQVDEESQLDAVGGERDAPTAMPEATDSRPMMVISLVENANVIVVSRNGDVDQMEGLSEVQSVLSVLNGSASILPATNDIVPVDRLVNTNAYDHESVMLGATWKKVLIATRNAAKGASKPSIPKSLKDSTFVYRARRPFHPTRLYQQIKGVATFNGVIRSTGRIWLATRMLAPLEWNQAGVAATLSLGKFFWAALPESEWPKDDKERERIMQDWDTQYGDRETEIVFVGIGIDKERLQGLLDGCLLQDEEMVFTNLWENFEDPFVEWVPLIEDDEDTSEENIQKSMPDVRAAQENISTAESQTDDFGSLRAKKSDDASERSKLSARDEASQNAAGVQSAEDTSRQRGVPLDQRDGPIEAQDIPSEVLNHASALDILERGFPEADESVPRPQPADDGSFIEEDVVIASWDRADADSILIQMPKGGLPTTLLTGFLGSGKTTLLNYILMANHGLKIAVLVNEFGEIDIDNQLVQKGDWSSTDEVMELANGCICCTINDSFVDAVCKVLERKDEVDYLIIETTGIADPVPVINSLMTSDVAEQIRVDGILTLVDAENFDPRTHMSSEAALSQIMAADTILLSKTDIASAEKTDKAIEFIRSVRPGARILKSQRGRVPINMILDVGVRLSDSPAHLYPVRQSNEKEVENKGCSEGCGSSSVSPGESNECTQKSSDGCREQECGSEGTRESKPNDRSSRPSNHLEADGFVTTSFKSDDPFDPDLFMENFLQKIPEGVFRAKGLLRFYGYGARYVFQLSGRRYQFEEDDWPDGVAPSSQLVLIGRDLDLESIRQTLEQCIVQDGA